MTESLFFLLKPLSDLHGNTIVPQGVMISKELLKEVAKKGGGDLEVHLGSTPIFSDFEPILEEEEIAPLIGKDLRDRILPILERVPLPEAVVEEIWNMRLHLPLLYHHSLATTVLFLRTLMEVVFKTQDLIQSVRANLLKDLGMTRIPEELHRNQDHLSMKEYIEIQRHTLLGLLLNTYYFGEGLEGMIALRHHMRNGHGYPPWRGLKPNFLVHLVEVVDIFYALISPRPFRKVPYDVRGALDELTDMAKRGEVGTEALKLFVSLFRKDRPEPGKVVFSEKKLGFIPRENFYGIGPGKG